MNLFKKYRIVKEEIFESKEYKLLKRSAISKIRKIEGIRITFHVEKIVQETVGNATDHSVFMKGAGQKFNKQGFMIDMIESTASATPKNCSFTYKMEVCEKRLEARIVLEMAGLHGWMSEDEVHTQSGSQPAGAKKANDSLLKALNTLKGKTDAVPGTN